MNDDKFGQVDAPAPKLLPRHIRPLAFAGGELVLDLLYQLQTHYKLDLESIVILLSINDATMRPFMLDSALDTATLTAEKPPEDIRGSISRLMLSDKTGLARETVRRKSRKLVELGLVDIDADDRLRVRPSLASADVMLLVENCNLAVKRYLDRLKMLNAAD